MNGQRPHPLGGWRFVKPPYPGGVTVLGRVGSGRLIVDVGGHQLTFDVTTGRFSPSSPLALNRPPRPSPSPPAATC